ncbi:restriction endonuclease subunit S [Sutcliffiella cohnii]|uniref:restriction endonuclease subunit S n=1 Tax=Sutcliffiella cohnii TaxID=33932 RepID=UPI002E1FC379|nr:restriction endonuclease subunit S [Sutcliffiella cohnii]MED4018045.1 restriction endonuclease subunit S [Sutcliffiella cohnii]
MTKIEFYKCEDILDVRDGTHDSPKYISNGYPLITSKNIKEGKIVFENLNYISSDDFEAINRRSKVDNGDILMPMIGTIGNPVIVNKQIEFAIKNVALFKFNDNDKVYNRYFYYFLKSDLFYKQLAKIKRGGTQNFISLKNIRNLQVPIPDIDTQYKIVEVLDTAYSLIEKRKAQIDALNQLTKSVFLEMFGDPIKNDKKWDLIPFEKVVLLQRGFDLPTKKRNLKGNINVYGSNGVLSFHDEPKVVGGGVITGRSGSIGNVYYTFDDFWPLNTTLFSKETYGNNIIFLKYLLKFFRLERFINGTGVPTLNRNIVHKELIYSIPIELQNKFGEIVITIENQIKKLEINLKILEEMYNSIEQRAFKEELFIQEKLPNA